MNALLLSTVLALVPQADDAAPLPHFEENLSVLFVGHDPAAPNVGMADPDRARTLPLLRERTPAWEALLRYHFADVRVVYSADYEVAMSDDADVTIFDARPAPLVKATHEVDPATGEVAYQSPVYLPDDFDRPMLGISDATPLIGESLGTKLDWL